MLLVDCWSAFSDGKANLNAFNQTKHEDNEAIETLNLILGAASVQ